MIAHLRIDEQHDFVDGSLAVPDALAAISAGNEINEKLKKHITTTICTQDWHPKNHASFASTNGAPLFMPIEITLPDGVTDKQVAWPDHCVEDTPGADFHLSQVVATQMMVVRKGRNAYVDSYSGFGDVYGGKYEKTRMQEYLAHSKITRVVITGLAGDYCVAYTAKDAVKHGYEVCVPLWATRAVSAESFDKEKAEMLALGVVLAETHEELVAWIQK